ncbi:10107_t:CDS:10 [Acaulospora colombiana]|uniref:10107_t:CDS:1 n=1 Tax=Acaulospora colombiana TaxID=27376 RepID=A0ACA9JUT4_9GLOM|nr:10107_t:CDS:10 [Acaulospora colombiana]
MSTVYDDNPSLAQRDAWAREQSELKLRLIEVDDLSFKRITLDKDGMVEFEGLNFIGGVDVSFIENNEQDAVASLVVLKYPSLDVIYEDFRMVKLKLPYIAGFLAFREVKPLVELLSTLRQTNPTIYPQVILVDGNGTLHPRRFGLASHLGVLANVPTVGVGKNFLHIDDGDKMSMSYVKSTVKESLRKGGDSYLLRGDSGAVRSLESTTNPIYVSIGHRISLETAVHLVLKCCRYRIPEPIRQADSSSSVSGSASSYNRNTILINQDSGKAFTENICNLTSGTLLSASALYSDSLYRSNSLGSLGDLVWNESCSRLLSSDEIDQTLCSDIKEVEDVIEDVNLFVSRWDDEEFVITFAILLVEGSNYKTRRIPELQLTAVRLVHEATGAEHLHIAREDDNNVFGVGFSTPPTDSSGTPHILEHTTLCGSKKFPVRDPFFKMLNRSLANFMNAFTADDYTIYPFSTTHRLDYENLRDVYMDSTFHPNLRELDFRQEGWRLEHQVPQDRSTPLQFKGVVYNEMKGQMSDVGYLFCSQVQKHMFPGTSYEHNSGGEPRHITDLTYEELLRFHRFHYHPSNAKFYTYGNFPLEEHLTVIDDKIKGFGKSKPDKGVKSPNSSEFPKRVKISGPLDPMNSPEKQTWFSISYLACDTNASYHNNPYSVLTTSLDVFESFALRMFAYLLLDGHASPMHKALIDTNIGSGFSDNTGYDSSTKMSSLSIGLQGMRSQDIELVSGSDLDLNDSKMEKSLNAEETIKKVFEDVRKDGFDPRRIEAALHQTELGKKHKTADFGLNLMHGLSSGWFNGINPADLLEINKVNIEELREKIKSGPFFQSLVEKHFLNNPHTLTCIMEPDPNFTEIINAEESKRLESRISTMTPSDQEQVYVQSLELLKKQEEKEDLSVLPTLKVEDIPLEMQRFPLHIDNIDGCEVQWRKTATNGITYFKAFDRIEGLPEDLRLYLPLFTQALTSLGTKKKTMAELEDEIRLYTDPKTLETLETYRQSIDWVLNRKFTQQEIDEAKLSIFQGIDAPISVAQEGMIYFGDRISDDLRQRRREQLLNVTEEDVKSAASAYLKQHEATKDYSVAIIGEENEEIEKNDEYSVYRLKIDGNGGEEED